MLPLRDDNPSRTTPIVTILIIVANVVMFLYQLAMGLERSVFAMGLVPAAFTHGVSVLVPARLFGGGEPVHTISPPWLAVLTSMFMHGGWSHIIGNMWFLWIFGNNVEDAMGKAKYLAFYLVSGFIAAMSQVLLGPDSVVPMVGASGAIGGVLGAYLVLFPGSRVLSLVPLGFFITTVELPAVVVLGLWFVLQVVSGLGALGHQAGGVAFAAHVGGFITGMLLGRLLGGNPARQPARWSRHLDSDFDLGPSPRSRDYGDWR